MFTNLELTGMHCGACVKRLTEAFGKVPGVKSAHVTLNPPEARIESDAPVPIEALDHAARGAGSYSARLSVADSPKALDAHDHTAVAPAEEKNRACTRSA